MKYDLKKIKKSLSDELFLGFYKKGSFKSSDYTKEEFEIYLKILKEMSLDKSFGKCEIIYEKNILIIIKDIEKILKNWKIDIKSLKKNDVFYTYKNEKYSIVEKWKIKKILNYSNLYFGSKKVFEVEKLDYKNMIIDKNHNTFLFTSDELFKYASLESTKFEIIANNKFNSLFPHFDKYFKEIDKY